jgi:L-threonylcarbamoyladenylate synthase
MELLNLLNYVVDWFTIYYEPIEEGIMMKTRIYTIQDLTNRAVQEDIKTTLQNGRNVVFPTETVYGIGASILSAEGINNIYKIKGRPSDNPLIMHLSNTDYLDQYVYITQPYVRQLMETFWPGPLTLVLDKKDRVSDFFTGGLKTVGVRIPDSDVARAIIDIAEVPICAPSANISGRPSATLFKHVVEDFNEKVDILIDGGKSQVGLESTVLDATKPIPVILRPGMITKEMIQEITKEVHVSTDEDKDHVPKSPGMKYKHYAPKGQLHIIDGSINDVITYINNKISEHSHQQEQVGVIATEEVKHSFIQGPFVYSIGGHKNETEIASNLFAALREMDALNVSHIYSMSFTNGEYSEAIMNRLMKAAGNKIIKLSSKT